MLGKERQKIGMDAGEDEVNGGDGRLEFGGIAVQAAHKVLECVGN